VIYEGIENQVDHMPRTFIIVESRIKVHNAP